MMQPCLDVEGWEKMNETWPRVKLGIVRTSTTKLKTVHEHSGPTFVIICVHGFNFSTKQKQQVANEKCA